MHVSGYGTRFSVGLAFLLISLGAACARPTPPPPPPAENEPPVIQSISPPGDVMALSQNIVTCTAADTDGDSLQYQWSAEAGTIEGTGAGIFWVAPDTVGRYAIMVKVTDGKGGQATQSVTARVITNADGSNNSPLTLKLSFAASNPTVEQRRARKWTTTTIICSVDNTAPGELKYAWSTGEGELQGTGIKESKADRVGWIAPGAPGDYTVAVTVTDSKGNQAKGEARFTVFCCGPVEFE